MAYFVEPTNQTLTTPKGAINGRHDPEAGGLKG